MPFMDGYQATVEILKYCNNRGIPTPYIVAVTGHGEEEHMNRARDSGMSEVILKPASFKTVLNALNNSRILFEK